MPPVRPRNSERKRLIEHILDSLYDTGPVPYSEVKRIVFDIERSQGRHKETQPSHKWTNSFSRTIRQHLVGIQRYILRPVVGLPHGLIARIATYQASDLRSLNEFLSDQSATIGFHWESTWAGESRMRIGRFHLLGGLHDGVYQKMYGSTSIATASRIMLLSRNEPTVQQVHELSRAATPLSRIFFMHSAAYQAYRSGKPQMLPDPFPQNAIIFPILEDTGVALDGLRSGPDSVFPWQYSPETRIADAFMIEQA